MNGVHYINKLHGDFRAVGLHSHDFWEVVYFTSGPGIAYVEGKAELFHESDVFVIPPHMAHKETCETPYTNIHLSFIDESFHKMDFIRFRDSDNHEIKTVLMMIYNEYHIKHPNYNAIINCLLSLLREYIDLFSQDKTQHLYVGKILNAIIKNISNPGFNLSETLKSIPLNRDYLRRLFLKETGLTPVGYLIEKRMDHAKQLLAFKTLSGLTVAEISYQSGYQDICYFSKTFKKNTGFSPIQWANNAGLNEFTTHDLVRSNGR